MRYEAKIIGLAPWEKRILEDWREKNRIDSRFSIRAQILLMAADGVGTNEIGKRLGIRPSVVSKWRGRFLEMGLPGLQDNTRSGRRKVPRKSGGSFRPFQWDDTAKSKPKTVRERNWVFKVQSGIGRLHISKEDDDQFVADSRSVSIAPPDQSPNSITVTGLFLSRGLNAIFLKKCGEQLTSTQLALVLPNDKVYRYLNRGNRPGFRQVVGSLPDGLKYVAEPIERGIYYRRRHWTIQDFLKGLLKGQRHEEVLVFFDSLANVDPVSVCTMLRNGIRFSWACDFNDWLVRLENLLSCPEQPPVAVDTVSPGTSSSRPSNTPGASIPESSEKVTDHQVEPIAQPSEGASTGKPRVASDHRVENDLQGCTRGDQGLSPRVGPPSSRDPTLLTDLGADAWAKSLGEMLRIIERLKKLSDERRVFPIVWADFDPFC